MNIHILQHESFEAPGAIAHWAAVKGFNVTYTRFYEKDALPTSLDKIDFLIVMGGPQCPSTTTDECPHFHSKEEIAYIHNAISENKFVLGICLGAQLIGEALGAKFNHSPNREIGVFDIVLTEEAKLDPIFSTFPDAFPVGHWHGDMPGLTANSKILAFSKGCPRQIVKYSPKIYGFQCHFEFNKECIEGLIQNSTRELEDNKSLPYVENKDVLRSHDFTQINQYLFKFLDYIHASFISYQSKL